MQITKSYLQGLFDRGFTVKAMKGQIKTDFNANVTIGYLKLSLHKFGFDLRRKPQRTDVVFVDDTQQEGDYTILAGYSQAIEAKSVDISSLLESAEPESTSPRPVSDYQFS